MRPGEYKQESLQNSLTADTTSDYRDLFSVLGLLSSLQRKRREQSGIA